MHKDDCGFCNGTAGMIELNDDGKTYTIHLHEDDKPVPVKVDLKTLMKLSDAITMQLFITRKEQGYEPIED